MTTIIDDDCNISEKKCLNSNIYDKDDIVYIADKCGIDIYKKGGKKLKTRKELCEEIANNQAVTLPINIPEQQIDIVNIPEPFIVNIPEQQEATVPLYTEDIIKNAKLPELKKIAKELGIKKWKGKNITTHCKASITEAILAAIAVKATLPSPLPEPTLIIVEDDPPNDIPLEVIEIPDKKTLEKKLNKELIKEAKGYGITRWKNKGIDYHKKADIVDAILDYFETIVVPTVVPAPVIIPSRMPSPVSSRIPSPVSSRIPSPIQTRMPSPRNIQELIKQKRQELLQVLKFKEQEKCNPLNNEYCSDNNVCDVNKTPNVCVSREEALYRENKGLAVNFDIGNKNLIGTEKQKIELMNKLVYVGGAEETKEPVDFVFEDDEDIETKRNPYTKNTMCRVCTYVNDPDILECIICNSDLNEEEINNVVLPEDTQIIERDIIPEGTKITELENIEEILNEIQKIEDTKINLEGMDESKKKVLYCLGLLN